MKLLVFIAIVAALTLVGGIMHISPSSNTPGTAEFLPPSLFLITPLQTVVSLKENSGEEFSELPGEREATEGATVRTSETGRAVIESGNTINMIVNRNSEVTVTRFEEEGGKTSMRLHGGALWARIEKTLEQGEFFEIETQNMVAVVRGTSFSVSYEDGRTTVLVREGTVATTAIDPETRERLPDTTEIIPAGKKSVRKGDNGIIVTDITDADRETEWYRLNTISGATIQETDTVSPAKPAAQNELGRTDSPPNDSVPPVSSVEKKTEQEQPPPTTPLLKKTPATSSLNEASAPIADMSEPESEAVSAPVTTRESVSISEQSATLFESVASPTLSPSNLLDNTRLHAY